MREIPKSHSLTSLSGCSPISSRFWGCAGRGERLGGGRCWKREWKAKGRMRGQDWRSVGLREESWEWLGRCWRGMWKTFEETTNSCLTLTPKILKLLMVSIFCHVQPVVSMEFHDGACKSTPPCYGSGKCFIEAPSCLAHVPPRTHLSSSLENFTRVWVEDMWVVLGHSVMNEPCQLALLGRT